MEELLQVIAIWAVVCILVVCILVVFILSKINKMMK